MFTDSHQIFCLTGDFSPVWTHHGVIPSHDLSYKHHLFPVPKWGSADEERVQDDTTGPGVDLEAIAVTFILKSPAFHLTKLFLVYLVAAII